MTFEDIKTHLSDGGAKSDAAIDKALGLLPLRLVLLMTPKEAASFVQNVHDEQSRIYREATR